MKIQLLFFGITTDLMNTNQLKIEVNTATSIHDFKLNLKENYPQLENINTYAIAVNEEYATDQLILSEGDVVAIIPPVSGG
ncbi:molybdopterin converting factor subunit 1 [Polaribacter sp.]|uniref:molybdopterin converting factor subunit 1 n=1 Tax=Polaribacter sp. TaxID=1920175 RepID=UPI003EFA18BB